jgi:ferrochelatase
MWRMCNDLPFRAKVIWSHHVAAKIGLLLVNLGTPEGPNPENLRPYLREFLSDPRVLDIPSFLRWCLVNLIIVPFRSRKSAKLYQSIWDAKRGSPLLFHGKDLAFGVNEELVRETEGSVSVELAMRYGKPSIEGALSTFAGLGIDDIIVFPLFPQYSSAAFGSAVAKIYSVAAQMWNVPRVRVARPYFDHPDYIQAVATVARPLTEKIGDADRVLFSYHGLPIRHCRKSTPGESSTCGAENCCKKFNETNRNCYRAQCIETSRLLAKALQLDAARWETVFQSRFGRDPWIGPFLEQRIVDLAKSGVKRLVVLTPSFTADCLETIEEIGDRAKASFLANGGMELQLVPCLNAHPAWIAAIVKIVKPLIS